MGNLFQHSHENHKLHVLTIITGGDLTAQFQETTSDKFSYLGYSLIIWRVGGCDIQVFDYQYISAPTCK